MMLLNEKVTLSTTSPQRWTAASKKFPYASGKAGVGPGEEKLAAELGGKIMGGSVSYDIALPGGKKLEVKELDERGQLRTGTEGAAASSQAVSQILKICDELADIDTVILKSAAKSDYPIQLDDFIAEDIPLIKKGEMTTPRMIGSEKKFGLLQALRFISALLKATADDEHTVSLDDKDVSVDNVQFARVADVVGIEDDELRVSPLSREMAKAKSRAFKDPEWFVDAVWARAAIPSEVFPDADALAIVSPDGYRLIPKSKLDTALEFTRISQGKPRFRIR